MEKQEDIMTLRYKPALNLETRVVSDIKVIGYVAYDVRVNCPHCDKRLNLNDYPYDSDETNYCKAEDELGLALFGRRKAPAKWEGLGIEYQCCGCEKFFYLGSIET